MNLTDIALQDLRSKAIAYAAQKHATQTYGGDKPYTFHLKAVADNVLKWAPKVFPNLHGASLEILVISAWLHDVLEDTDATKEELAFQFGEEVAELVWLVTNEPGKNRKERHLATYPKIRSSFFAVFIKLMDRLANLEADGKAGMYIKEHGSFREALHQQDEFEQIWMYLDDLIDQKRKELYV